ncbi:hypothetical protein Scep_016990 [Stephania cephalantha]|uniref:Uncharacterized protein n=1 Tax=Stephania cephalantha TaxID=152367 RepID=A0AAP0NT63_9MAGN
MEGSRMAAARMASRCGWTTPARMQCEPVAGDARGESSTVAARSSSGGPAGTNDSELARGSGSEKLPTRTTSTEAVRTT